MNRQHRPFNTSNQQSIHTFSQTRTKAQPPQRANHRVPWRSPSKELALGSESGQRGGAVGFVCHCRDASASCLGGASWPFALNNNTHLGSLSSPSDLHDQWWIQNGKSIHSSSLQRRKEELNTMGLDSESHRTCTNSPLVLHLVRCPVPTSVQWSFVTRLGPFTGGEAQRAFADGKRWKRWDIAGSVVDELWEGTPF